MRADRVGPKTLGEACAASTESAEFDNYGGKSRRKTRTVWRRVGRSQAALAGPFAFPIRRSRQGWRIASGLAPRVAQDARRSNAPWASVRPDPFGSHGTRLSNAAGRVGRSPRALAGLRRPHRMACSRASQKMP